MTAVFSSTAASPAPPLHANITFFGDGTILYADRCNVLRVGNGNYVIGLDQAIDIGSLAPFYYSFDRGRRVFDTGWNTISVGTRELVTALLITTYNTTGTPTDTSLVVAIARTTAGLLPPG